MSDIAGLDGGANGGKSVHAHDGGLLQQARRASFESRISQILPRLLLSHNEFMIVLQMNFVRTEVIDRLLQLFGNISSEEVRTSSDDGVTQQVVVKQGIKLVDWQTIPTPVLLQPYRTFPEVE